MATVKLKSKLLASASLKDLNIGINTQAGVIALHGTATSKAQIDPIAALAQSIETIKGLDNKSDSKIPMMP